MRKEILKITSLILSAVSSVTFLSGCQRTLSAFNPEEVKISIGDWVSGNETNEKLKADFEKENPGTEIIPMTYVFSLSNFEERIQNNQIPNLYRAYFTEIDKLIDKGYALDLTDILNEVGWTQYMNPELKSLLSDENGHIYGIPYEVYAQGLYINKKIFRDADLVDDQGNILYPKTLEELAEFSAIIKEKTGKAGYIMPTVKNCGGWHFMNIAWNFGTNFMQEQADGTYKATFDTQETKDALQFIKDLKWKYDALPDKKDIDNEEMNKLFTTGEAAMMFCPPMSFSLEKYGMSKDDIMVVGMPSGPAGCYSQMGGTAYIVLADTTEEQLEKIIKWIEFIGRGPDTDERQLKLLEDSYKNRRDNGMLVLSRDTFNIWLNESANAKRQEVRMKYCNIDPKDYEDYYKFSGIQIRPEEKVHCQDMYSVLDKCVQAVINDKNADVSVLISNANQEFQTKFLDN